MGDAQVEGHIVNVAPRVAGQVAECSSTTISSCHAGDALVRLERVTSRHVFSPRAPRAAAAVATRDAAAAQLALTEAPSPPVNQQARAA